MKVINGETLRNEKVQASWIGSLLKGAFKEQEISFKDVLAQLAEGKKLTLSGQEIDLEENQLGGMMALNRWVTEQETISAQFWKLYNFDQKMVDQLASLFG